HGDVRRIGECTCGGLVCRLLGNRCLEDGVASRRADGVTLRLDGDRVGVLLNERPLDRLLRVIVYPQRREQNCHRDEKGTRVLLYPRQHGPTLLLLAVVLRLEGGT